MGNKPQGMPFRNHPAQGHEQVVDFLGDQHRRGFIQDDHAGTPVECFHDLDALLLPHRELPDVRMRLDIYAVRLR